MPGLREETKKKVEARLSQEAEDALAQQIVVELCKANEVPVPPSLVRKQAEMTEQEIMQRARSVAEQDRRFDRADGCRE